MASLTFVYTMSTVYWLKAQIVVLRIAAVLFIVLISSLVACLGCWWSQVSWDLAVIESRGLSTYTPTKLSSSALILLVLPSRTRANQICPVRPAAGNYWFCLRRSGEAVFDVWCRVFHQEPDPTLKCDLLLVPHPAF